MFEEPSIWPRIGYEVVRGRLALGAPVTVRRSPDSYPGYFAELLKPDEAIQCGVFKNSEEQYSALANSIWENIHEDELEPTDILVILPSAYTSKKTGASVMSALAKKNIPAHLAGVTTSRDEIFTPNSVAVTHIFRAKGNEAPMVYIVNAEFCQIGFELSRKRNILFTGITRSKCWVRLFGVGEQMAALKTEVDRVRAHNFELEFTYPNQEQLKRLARVHRDMTNEERKDWERKISTVGDVFRAVLDGDLPLEALPKDIRDKLAALSDEGRKAAK
jgi:superfamily I DNA and RNA helicase